MGILYTRRGMGVYVNDNVRPKCIEFCQNRIVRRMYEVASEAVAAGMDEKMINGIVNRSLAIEGRPYDDVPQEVFDWVRTKRRAK